jgi:hypothetical protein
MKYRKGYKYQLAEDEYFQTKIYPVSDIKTQFIELYTDGLLIVRSGYAWDGASGPTIDTKSAMRGPLAHDALYQLMRWKLLDKSVRPLADDLMYTCLLEDRMMKWRAYFWHREVGKFAGFAADPKNRKRVYEAP